MIVEPIYTYAAVGFIIGVVVGLGLCCDLLRRINKQADNALSMLNAAIERERRATALYQEAARERIRILDALMKFKRVIGND